MHVGPFSVEETTDSYAIIEWLGSRPWSNGKVGMSGRSYPGTKLEFDLMGTAIVIDAGHRIRVTVTGADAANFAPYPDPEDRDAPTIEVLRGGETASYIELPVATGSTT